ncbi:MAG: thioredoxin family protein [Ignavibacteriaceae bacterium]
MNKTANKKLGGDTLKDLLVSKKPVLLEVRDDKCCCSQLITPVFSKIENEFNNSFKLERIDYETHKEFLQKFNVENIPTVLLLKSWKVMKQINGTISRRNLNSLVMELLKD